MARALWRAVLFQTPGRGDRELTSLAARCLSRPSLWLDVRRRSLLVLFGLLFSTARRRNGFAAVHELASGTRMVRRPERGVRSALDVARRRARAAAGADARGTGPTKSWARSDATDVGELLIGVRRHASVAMSGSTRFRRARLPWRR